MHAPGTPSVDQLLVLLTVVEVGSFTAAAKRLRRATSAVSYAIDALEEQLGISLFDRGTTRKPKLTRQGEAIVSEARAVAQSVETLRARVKGLLDHLEPELSLVVDCMLPSERLVALLRDFHAKFPTVPVRLLVQALGGVERAIRTGAATIGVGNALHMDLTGFRQIDVAGVRVIPVAAPGHPLASAGETSPTEGRDFVQIVLSEQPLGESRDFAVVSLNTWRVGDLTAKHKLILGGIGWGGMPEPMVRADIEAGRLVRLNLRDWRGGEHSLRVVHKIDAPPGPAGRWLIERFAASDPETEAHDAAKPANAKRQRKQQPRSRTRKNVAVQISRTERSA